jgi:glycosyltransferase involved in cell wall biosynthesis
VIGAQAWGVKTVIDDGQDGLLVPFGDVSALVDAIRTLAENPELRLSMGERGRRKVVAHHTWGHKYSRVRQIYARLVENGDGTA